MHQRALLNRTLGAAALCLALTAHAGVDDDLRQAAKLHKGGDTPAALTIWQHWAGKGNVDAAYNLAVIHQYGDGVAQDYAKAMTWYRQAADQGDRTAQFQIGLMYQNGEGVAADQEEAHRWFTAHLKHHFHHQHTPQMQAWRQQAAVLIAESDRREALAASRVHGAEILADLKRRAGMGQDKPTATAALDSATHLR